MTEQERNRQHWKALRAPVVQMAWDAYRQIGAYDSSARFWFGYSRSIAGRMEEFMETEADRTRFLEGDYILQLGYSLNILTAMIEARKAGENALMWKLSQP